MSIPNSHKYFTLLNPATTVVQPLLGLEDSTFELHEEPFKPTLLSDEVLIKVIYLSNDPTQRGWIQKDVDAKRLYVPPVYQGQVMRSLGLCQVVEVGSLVTNYQLGDFATGVMSWSDYTVVKVTSLLNKVTDTSIPLSMYLDVVGMTGLTAYVGLTKIANFQEGQTIIVSAASGATGNMVVQLAKKVFKASKVIAITGSDEKCEYVKSLGADISLNYKKSTFDTDLQKAVGDDYVDCYFDLVGGHILDQCLKLIKSFGTVVACGAITGYNDLNQFKIGNWPEIITNRLKVQGFIVGDNREVFPLGIKTITELLKNGQIKTDQNTISVVDITDDFTKVPQVWNRLFTDEKGNGKLLSKLSNY